MVSQSKSSQVANRPGEKYPVFFVDYFLFASLIKNSFVRTTGCTLPGSNMGIRQVELCYIRMCPIPIENYSNLTEKLHGLEGE